MITVFKIDNPPPPRPCSIRPPISMLIVWLSAAMRLPARKIAFAASNAAFLPMTSDSLVHKGVDAVLARLYPPPTQVYCAALALKLLAIVGNAVATMVISIAERNWARQSESKTSLRREVPILLTTSTDFSVGTRCKSVLVRWAPVVSVISLEGGSNDGEGWIQEVLGEDQNSFKNTRKDQKLQ